MNTLQSRIQWFFFTTKAAANCMPLQDKSLGKLHHLTDQLCAHSIKLSLHNNLHTSCKTRYHFKGYMMQITNN